MNEDVRVPSSPEILRPLLEENERVIEEYCAGYEWDAGEDGYHNPSDQERMLIEDAINGLLADDQFLLTFNAWQDKVRAAAPAPAAPAANAELVRRVDSTYTISILASKEEQEMHQTVIDESKSKLLPLEVILRGDADTLEMVGGGKFNRIAQRLREAAAALSAQASNALVEALRPFGAYYNAHHAEDHAPDSKQVFTRLTLGDFRRAAALSHPTPASAPDALSAQWESKSRDDVRALISQAMNELEEALDLEEKIISKSDPFTNCYNALNILGKAIIANRDALSAQGVRRSVNLPPDDKTGDPEPLA